MAISLCSLSSRMLKWVVGSRSSYTRISSEYDFRLCGTVVASICFPEVGFMPHRVSLLVRILAVVKSLTVVAKVNSTP